MSDHVVVFPNYVCATLIVQSCIHHYKINYSYFIHLGEHLVNVKERI